jgi:hypothetical protein
MARFRGLRCSGEWATVLEAAERAGVRFDPTSLQRTFAEQAELRRRYERGEGPLAAKPSHNAPHIRTGRPDHADDVKWTDGGVYRLARWLRARGARVFWTVPGERWHIEVPRADLVRLARKLADPFRGYPADERRWLREYDDLKRRNRDRDRREVLRRVMTARRKSIWRAAQESGWEKLRRRERYASLLARTK